jgi:hypothetical protein
MRTLTRRAIFWTVCAMLTGCTMTPAKGIAIDVLCDQWRRSLPSRSQNDTQQTQDEIGRAIIIYEAACDDEL